MFKKYVPKGCKSAPLNYDYAMVTKNYIRFSTSAWKERFNSSPHLDLFYDEENRVVGILPTKEGGLTVIKRSAKSSVEIRWAGFTKQFGLVFDRPFKAKLYQEGADKMITIRLKEQNHDTI